MPSKEELIKGLTKSTYRANEVADLLHSVTTKVSPPSRFKKGDVVIISSGGKHRPAVVAKVFDTTLAAIPLSTTEDELNLMPYTSRFLGQGYFGKYIVTLDKEKAFKFFAGVFDNSRDLNKAIALMKEYVNQL